MKRRAISLIIVFALCLSLCPVRALAAGEYDRDIVTSTLTQDTSSSKTLVITGHRLFDTAGYTYTVSADPAIRVSVDTEKNIEGKLYLTAGTVKSTNGAGIAVQPEGFLRVDQANMTVTGTTYGLVIESGATVKLSGGTFTGGTAAIQAPDYGALLASTDDVRYAYFNKNGEPVPLARVGDETTVTVKECTDHSYTYTANGDTPTHDGICVYCGSPIADVPCTFSFDANGSATCTDCGRKIAITVTIADNDLVYDGNPRPDSVTVKVTLDDSTTLTENTDYEVKCTKGTSVGEIITIIVTGITYNGTYKMTFSVTQATPVITWEADSKTVDYDGNPVEKADLPEVIISGIYAGDSDALKNSVRFSYKRIQDGNGNAVADTGYIDGLPTDAGTYEIIASLPETQNYHAAESDPITLTINKIDPIIEAPKAVKPVYNKTEQKLVTSGMVNSDAVILFATSADGPWSTDIPTGTNAGDYIVYYKVDGTNNYNEVQATSINSVKIQRKPITPDVVLEYTSYVYTGGEIQPKVMVLDKEDGTVLPVSEYTVTYSYNVDVGDVNGENPPTVTVTDKEKGNYAIKEVKVKFEITAADQDALTITNRPNRVVYGDVFTLETTGGSGNGTVTWKITAVKDGTGNPVQSERFAEIAEIGQASGQVTVKGIGTVTVQATKSGTDNDGNHTDATAVWTFTSGKKPVTAIVTAEDKTYDGTNTATVQAEVPRQDIVSGDEIKIEGLSGTFSDANAGTNKTVTVTGTATISGTGSEKYTVTVPTTPVKADITKAATEITLAPTSTTLTYKGAEQELVKAGTAYLANDTSVEVPLEYALSAGGPYSTYIPTATNAGSYEVWYRVPETNNYYGTTAAKVTVTIDRKQIDNPTVKLDQNSYVYDGTEKKPAVTVKDGDDVIPASEYTVAYSNNVNVGTATVTVTAKAGGNYEFTATQTFTISKGGSAVLTGSPQARDLTYNGQAQDLVTVGTASGGSLVYALKGDNTEPAETDYKAEIPQGTNAGLYKVWYKVKGDDNHTDSASAYVYVTIQPKTVTSPDIILPADETFTYDGSEKKFTGTITVKDGTTPIGSDEYTITYSNNVNAGTATIHIVNANGGNYIVNGSKTFEIKKATASFSTEPTAKQGLTYNGKAQPLITAGVAKGGTAVYSLEENGPYFTSIPTGTDSGSYTVWAKVLGDANHEDSEIIKITVNIAVSAVTNPIIELSASNFQYNGSEQKPTVTVRDDKGYVIPANEYTVKYGNDGESTVDQGTYTITVTCKEGGNYSFTEKKETFKILPADQTPLTITGKPNVVYYGDTIQLSATGGSGSGTVTWSITVGIEYIEQGKGEGQFKIIKAGGPITITATRTSGNYADAVDTWTFYAYPKLVTAVVTAADKTYDGTDTATLTVTVPGTDITIAVKDDFKGTFNSANVGTNKTVALTGLSDNVTVTGDENYTITYPSTTTASITPADVTILDANKPKKESLTYNGSAQPLLTAGADVDGGKWAYSLDGVNYNQVIPTATDAGTYKVWYKMIGDNNHTDSEANSVVVTITAKTVTADNLEVLCTPSTFVYDGTEKTPTVIVMDKTLNRVVPASEYTVEYPPARIAAATYTVTVKDRPNSGNYEFTDNVTGTFTIAAATQNPFSIITDKAPTVYYGDSFLLSAIGGSGTGAVTWSIECNPAEVATITQDGVVTVNGVGKFTVKAYRDTDGSYSKSNEYTLSFFAQAKPVTAVVTAKDKVYDGDNVVKELTVTVPGTTIRIEGVTGTFDDKNVGANKTVTIEYKDKVVTNGDNYDIFYPATTTASITPAKATLDGITMTASNLTYNGKAQALVTPSSTTVDSGNLAYSLDGVNYSLDIPTGINAGTYTVRYKVLADSNHTDSEVKFVTVTIAKAKPTIATNPVASAITSGQSLSSSVLSGGRASLNSDGRITVPGTFTWTNDNIVPASGTEYSVTFTPDDRINYESITTQVEVTVVDDSSGDNTSGGTEAPGTPGTSAPATPAPTEPGTETPSIQTSVRNGTASTVVNGAAGDQLVDEAVANQSKNVIIKPEITGGVTKTEVLIPASAVSRLSSETDAALTVSTPVADVTIPNRALEALSGAGNTIGVVTERVDNTVVLTLTVDGRELRDLPDGLTLIVPMENAGPGTVAVVICEDGTRETVRWSIAADGAVRIPLNGSVTVEIVDNSKEFSDVSAGSWAADAVAFAGAHEIFSGTGDGAFSPDQAMSRAMLATMFYVLEGRPEQEPANAFSDIDSGAWYVTGVSWAAANGLISSYEDGQFGPNDSMTREQLVTMFWKYAGSPAVDEQALSFTDADRASDDAVDALRWALASGLICGVGGGRLDPTGLATRAQAAQMLKNFMESL